MTKRIGDPSSNWGRELGAVLAVYQGKSAVANDDLYEAVREPLGIGQEEYERLTPVGRSGRKHNLAKRRVRWVQQTLQQAGLLEKVPGQRGVWRMRGSQDRELTPAPAGMRLLAFSTNLGFALWADCEAMASIEERVALILTSPPYPIAKGRKYGTWTAQELVDFVCRSIEPLLPKMLPGASLSLNLSQDSFMAGTPARSTYLERLILALEKMGLHLMDRIVWESPKAPGPTRWASISRQQLCYAWEPVINFTNDPLLCFADNRRVLLPHSERNQRLIEAGGERRSAAYQDGAHRLRAGKSFAAQTPGTIPKNVLKIPQHDAEIYRLRNQVRSANLPMHGGLMPLRLAKFLVQFLTEEGQLVVDHLSGWGTTARAAEETGRRWITTERYAEHVAAQSLRMADCPGFRSRIPQEAWALLRA